MHLVLQFIFHLFLHFTSFCCGIVFCTDETKKDLNTLKNILNFLFLHHRFPEFFYYCQSGSFGEQCKVQLSDLYVFSLNAIDLFRKGQIDSS